MKPLGGRKVEAPERMVDVTRVDTRGRRGDRTRLAPERLTLEDPYSLVFREVLDLRRSRTACAHDKRSCHDLTRAASARDRITDCLLRYLAITLKFKRPISSTPREAVTITFQVPPIESWPLPR